jgi:hypothetical protein
MHVKKTPNPKGSIRLSIVDTFVQMVTYESTKSVIKAHSGIP